MYGESLFDLTTVIFCVTNCYMRSIMNISLPTQMANLVRDEIKSGGYASVSEFFRELVREWSKQKAINDVKISMREYEQGKVKVLRSLADLR